MMRRAISAFGFLIALSQTASAGVLFGHVSCTLVRYYVGKYSAAAAENWARSHGYSDSDIETARRCLHSDNMQTARAPTNSQPPTRVTQLEPAPHEADGDRNKEAPPAVSVQAQRADAEQVHQDNKPDVNASNRPKNVDDPSAGDGGHVTKDLVPSARKTSMPRHRYAGVKHRAGSGHLAWFKRLWDQLTGRRPFRVAVLHFSAVRR